MIQSWRADNINTTIDAYTLNVHCIQKNGTQYSALDSADTCYPLIEYLGEEGQCLAYTSPSGYNFKQFILTQAISPFKIKTQHVIL